MLPVGTEIVAELGGDHDLVPDGGQRFAHQFLVRERTVDLGGVEEGDAALDGRTDQRDHSCLSRAGCSSRSFTCSRALCARLPVAVTKSALLHESAD